MLSDAAYQDLEKALGAENVSREPVVLDSYCWQTLLNGGPDMWRPRPVAVTLPGSTEDVQAVVRICNAHALKCKAFSTGWGAHGSVGKDDVVQLDLRRMNRILEIDEKNMYAVIEPYVIGGVLQAEVMKMGLNAHLIGAGPGHSPLASATSMQGMGWDSIYMSTSFRNLLGVEWVLPSGEILRLGTLGSGSGWFCADGPGPSLRAILRGLIGTCGGFGVFTKCAVKLFHWPGPSKPDGGGTPLDARGKGLEDNFGLYMCAFPNLEKYVDANYALGDAEIGYLHHKTSLPTMLALLTPRLVRKLAGKPALQALMGVLKHQFIVVLAGDTKQETDWQRRTLAAIVADHDGLMMDFAAFPSLWDMFFWNMIRCTTTPLAFRATGSFLVHECGDESFASQALAGRLREPDAAALTAAGVSLDLFDDNLWAPTYENNNRAHSESLVFFDHRRPGVMEAIGKFNEDTAGLVLANFLNPGLLAIDPRVRKAFSAVACGYNEYQKRILAALDPARVSDSTFYTDEA